jgi:hypothetical protein
VGDAEEVKKARRKNTPLAAATRRVKPSHAAARGTGSEPGEGLLGRRHAADVDDARTSKVKGKDTAAIVGVSDAMNMKNRAHRGKEIFCTKAKRTPTTSPSCG